MQNFVYSLHLYREKLSGVDQNLIQATKAFENCSEECWKLVEGFVEAKELVEWLKENIEGKLQRVK